MFYIVIYQLVGVDVEEKFFLKTFLVLTSMDLSVGHHPPKQKVSSSVPGQGTCLSRRPVPQLGRVQEATN